MGAISAFVEKYVGDCASKIMGGGECEKNAEIFRQGTNGSMRGRLGYSFDRVMVYGTGGFAVTNYEYRNRIGQISRMRAGTVLGAGAELMLTDNVAVRGEVLHYKYSKTSFAGIGGPENFSPTNNVFRGGLNYKF
jgi:outer membrane immunogenic protein